MTQPTRGLLSRITVGVARDDFHRPTGAALRVGSPAQQHRRPETSLLEMQILRSSPDLRRESGTLLGRGERSASPAGSDVRERLRSTSPCRSAQSLGLLRRHLPGCPGFAPGDRASVSGLAQVSRLHPESEGGPGRPIPTVPSLC